MDPIKRIKELCALKRSGKITPEELAELKELQAKFPKPGRKPGNDFSFWNDFPQLMEAAAKVAYNRIPGIPVQVKPGTGTGNKDYEPATLMVIDYQAAIGSSKDATSAINLSMRNLWLDMHRKYRGLGSYEYPDLAISELCILDVWGWIAEFERVYGILNVYPVENRVAPNKLLRAMGFTNDAIKFLSEHQAEFRYRLNRAIVKAERLCLPRGFKYLDNRVAMNAFIYSDSMDKRAVQLVFKQTKHWKYCIDTNLGGYIGIVNNTLYTANSTTSLESYFSGLIECIDALASDTDIARICSDLLAAVGPENMEMLKPMDESYKVTATYNENMLLKLHNAEIYGTTGTLRTGFKTAADLTQFNGDGKLKPLAYQKDGVVISIPIINTPATSETSTSVANFGYVPANSTIRIFQYGEWQQHYIDTWKENPGVETVCEASLWKTARHTNSNYFAGFDSCSTEVLTLVHVYYYLGDDMHESTISSLVNIEDPITDVAAVTQIDWHPVLALMADVDDALSFQGVLGDVDNLTWNLDSTTIAQIHDAALLSAFNIKLAVKA